MAIRVACLRCSYTFTVRSEPSGKKEVCPKCGATDHIQLFATEQQPEPSEPPEEPSAGVPPVTSSKGVPSGQPGKRSVMPVRAGFVLLAAGLVVVAVLGFYVVSDLLRPDMETVAQDHQATGEKPKAKEKSTASSEDIGEETAAEGKSEGRKTDGASDESTLSDVKVAKSLEEAKEAIVKFELPLGIGNMMQYGAGFFVDQRGWIATNHHLAANMTTAARVKMADGRRLEIEGIVARAANRDLALVKLTERPSPLTILEISYEGNPGLGEQVYAFGHPYNAEFSLSKGIVGRVLTTAEVLENSRRHVVARIGAPADLVWIQHDAKISPGNSGGPLIDSQGRVFGTNTFVHLAAEFGYASHVKYLRELVAGASEEITPLPAPRSVERTVVSIGRMKQLSAAVAAFGWKPQQPQDYESLAELAKLMTLAKRAQATRGNLPGTTWQTVQNVARYADQQFQAMQSVAWSQEHFDAINRFAVDQVDKVAEGVMLVTTVLDVAQNQRAVVMDIQGTQRRIVVQVGPSAMKLPQASRWLVVGFVTPQVVEVRGKDQSVTQGVRVVMTDYMLLVK